MSCSIKAPNTLDEHVQPLWTRITGLWLLPPGEVTQYLNGALHKQEADSHKRGYKKGGDGHRVKVWAKINGEIKLFNSISALASAIGFTAKTLANKKCAAKNINMETSEAGGVLFGWGEPPRGTL